MHSEKPVENERKIVKRRVKMEKDETSKQAKKLNLLCIGIGSLFGSVRKYRVSMMCRPNRAEAMISDWWGNWSTPNKRDEEKKREKEDVNWADQGKVIRANERSLFVTSINVIDNIGPDDHCWSAGEWKKFGCQARF